LLVAIGSVCGDSLVATALGAQTTPLVVSTDWLASHLTDPQVVVLDISLPSTGSGSVAGHIPGARNVPYVTFITTVNGIATELPSADSLRALFEAYGVSTTSHIILTGPPLAVTRAFFTLDYLGLPHVSALDGGVTEWKREGRPIESQAVTATRGHIVPNPRPSVVALAPWVLANIGKPGISLIDTRTPEEYAGVAERHGYKSNGHIEGARLLEWQSLFLDEKDFALKPRAELDSLWRERVAPGDTVVAYCMVGYRASATYFVSRLLGYPVKLYDGSYQEWSMKKLPEVTAATPLRTP